MSRALIFDPRSERAANAPLEIHTEVGRGPGIYTLAGELAFPDPPQEIRSTQASLEGTRRSGPPMLGNRRIPIGLWVMGRRESYSNRTNYCTNPSFEVDLTGWSQEGTTINERVIDEHIFGEASMKVTSPSTSSGARGSFGVPANQTYTASAWVKAAVGTPLRIVISELDAAMASIGNAVTSFVGTGEWQRVSVTRVFGATGVNARIALRSDNANSQTMHVDAVMLEKGADLRDYFGGDQPGRSWTGAAHASTSFETGDPDDLFEALAIALEDKLRKIRDEGGTLSRPWRAGRGILDLEGLVEGGEGAYNGRHWIQRGQSFKTMLEARPYQRRPVSVRTLRSQTSDPVLVFTEEDIDGTARAAGSLEVIDTAAVARRGLVAAFENPDYDHTLATAALYYQAEALTPLGAATLVNVSGAVGAGNNVIRADLSTDWQAIASTKLAGGSHLTHVGSFRLIGRLKRAVVQDGARLAIRLEWATGDLTETELNDAKFYALANTGFILVEYGIVRIGKAAAGAQRWEGRIQAKAIPPDGGALTVTPRIELDDLRIAPTGIAFIKAVAPRPKIGTPASYHSRDGFKQSAGDLNGKTSDSGHVWNTTITATAGDFTLDTANDRIIRAQSEIGERIGVLGPLAAGAIAARIGVGPDNGEFQTDIRQAVVVRCLDQNHYLRFETRIEGTVRTVRLVKVVAGTPTVLETLSGAFFDGDLGLYVSGSGYVAAFFVPAGADLAFPLIETYDAVLETAGTLGNGYAGVYDFSSFNPVSADRVYERFAAWIPPDPVLIHPSRKLRWAHDGLRREDVAGGDLWSQLSYEGDPLFVPPATREDRVLRGIVFPTRGDFDLIPDAGASDDFTAQLSLIERDVNVRG